MEFRSISSGIASTLVSMEKLQSQAATVVASVSEDDLQEVQVGSCCNFWVEIRQICHIYLGLSAVQQTLKMLRKPKAKSRIYQVLEMQNS